MAEVGDRAEQGALDGNMETLKKKLATVMRRYKLATYKRGVEEERAQTKGECSEMVARSESWSWCNTSC